MRYTSRTPKRRWPKRLIILGLVGLVLIVGTTFAVRQYYSEKLKPVSAVARNGQLVTIKPGATLEQIAKQLEDAGLIRSAWAFKLYVGSKNARESLQAGTYSLDPSQSVGEIVAQLTHGKVATGLVTFLPGHRIDQIRSTLRNVGFTEKEVDEALNAANYQSNPALVDKPKSASLEGYLFPDSYQKDSSTTVKDLVLASLTQMEKQLTPELRAAYAKQGLSTYEAIIVASIVEKEAANEEDRAQVAQVYLTRLKIGMRLEADPTAQYGARLAGHTGPANSFDSDYNTYKRDGLPPGPISNVSSGSLKAVAKPATTDWLYFVAGDDGTTHFSHTLAEHEAATAQYCKKLCSQ